MRWFGFRLRACAEALTALTILLTAPGTALAQTATAELPRDLSPVGHVSDRPIWVVKARDDRARVRLGRHLDGLARQDRSS